MAPCAPLFIVSAILLAAPSASFMYPLSSLNLSPEFANSAFTDFKSTLLKILFKTCVCSPCVIVLKVLSKSLNISLRGRILPWASNTSSPNSCIFLAALSVGADKDKITFLSAVPPSAPLTPLSANIPSAVFISVVPPANTLAVPPTVNIASPNWATLVFDFWEVLAILSTKLSVVPAISPKADILSVTISDAVAKSIPPAAAKFKTLGNVDTDLSTSYPASAI